MKKKAGETSGLKFLAMFFFGLFFGFELGSSFATMGAPMVVAMVAGEKTAIPYTIVRYKRDFDRGCNYPLILKDMPWMFAKLCGFPEEFTSAFKPGMKVLVMGRGTDMGLFVRSARRMDDVRAHGGN